MCPLNDVYPLEYYDHAIKFEQIHKCRNLKRKLLEKNRERQVAPLSFRSDNFMQRAVFVF